MVSWMRTRRIRWFLWLVSLAVVLLVASFVAGAVLAEGALHPLLRRRASDTEALAYSISQSVSAKAQKVGLQTNHGVRLSAGGSCQNGRMETLSSSATELLIRRMDLWDTRFCS